ncbi:MAG: alpha/beta fold hydrolase [Desulfobacterales bacterium]|nr:alpha/beta fold hydrolase [Desulfobacterales bacterium]
MSEQDTNIEHISFSCDGLTLYGFLHLPATQQPPVVIGCHGLYSSSSSPKQIALAEQCNRFGIAYFRFDHRGCGDSEGEFEKVTSLEARCRDLIAAADILKNRTDTGDQIGLFGSSMGGTVCLSVASRLGAAAIVTFAAPIRSQIAENDVELSDQSNAPGIYLDAARRRFDITERLSDIHSALIFHGDADDVVPVSHAEEIYQLAQKPKKKIIQENGDHPMSNEGHQLEFVRETALWFEQILIATDPHGQLQTIF